MTMMSVRTAAAWAIASQYTSFTIQFVTSVILARWFITPADLGLFTIAFAAVSLISFVQDFGINRYIAGERDLTPDKIQLAFSVSAAFALSIALAAILAAWPIAWFYGDSRLLPVTLVVACSYLMIPLAIVPQALCQRRLDYRSNTMIEVGASLANAVVAVLLAVRGYGALALAGGAFAQQAARMAVAQWRAGGLLPWPLSFRGVAPLLAIGKAVSVSSICWTIITRAPELVIGRMLSSAAVGLYSRAAGLAMQMRLLVAGAVTGVFYPAFRAVRDRGEPLGPPYLRVVAAYTGITWPAMAGIAALAWPLINLLYGPKWIASAPLLAWVAVAQIGYTGVPLNGDLPVLLGRLPALVRRNLFDACLCISLALVAAPFGLHWVAIAVCVHGFSLIPIYAPLMRDMLGIAWRDLITVWAKSAAVAVAAVTPVLASYELFHGPQHAGLAQMLGSAGAGVLCWLVALRLTRHALYAELASMLGELRTAMFSRPASASGK